MTTANYTEERSLEGKLCEVPGFRKFILDAWTSRYQDTLITPDREENYKNFIGEIAQVALEELAI